MTQQCAECGAHTAWDDDAGSTICTQCGTLSDPSQTLLTDQSIFNAASQASGLWDGAAPTTLKSFRGQGPNWDLAGQGKEARDRKNSLAMAQFISSLAISINASGLSPRAIIIFNQSMASGNFRWGRKAKLVAGASLAIALREYRRPDSLNDIAYLLDEHCHTLVRTLTGVVSLLEISLTPVDPSIYIPPLLDYLTSIVTDDPLQPQSQPTVQLPAPLLSQLKLVSLRAASNTAIALSNLLARLGPDHPLNSLPSPPTAVALFLLGLEAESRTPLSQLGELAQCLGARCHKTCRGVAMTRYKIIQDEVASWIEQVPWLGKYEQRSLGKGKNRAKIGKRSIVARGIADVLQFQEEIWRGRLRPTVVLDTSDQDQEEDKKDLAEAEVSTTTNVATTGHRLPNFSSRPPPHKRQKVVHHPLRDATQFLLNPLTAPLPACDSLSRRPQPQAQVQAQVQGIPLSPPPFQNNAHRASTSMRSTTPSHPLRNRIPSRVPPATLPQTQTQGHTQALSRGSLTSYVLTAPNVSALSSVAPPTRLQLLAASRATAADIRDDELFEDGELEGFLRPAGEAEEMRTRLVGLGILTEEFDKETSGGGREGKSQGWGKGKGKEKRMEAGEEEDSGGVRKSRVDLKALARFLKNGRGDREGDDDKDEGGAYDAVLLGLERFPDKDEEDEDLFYDDHDDGGEVYRDEEEADRDRELLGGMKSAAKRATMAMKTPTRPRKSMLSQGADEAEIVVAEWRPLSPETGFGCARGGAYEEEYD
ncbi:hypothetical protein D9615_001887 [Tricholomella constricta]|uniref:B-related factor 1 n=1 Tax=Tricholomella constricta TaxID=117010 RepID=A0A8H5MAJ4_9AGAR|nr:hypothetical protein D9615_001887 [Tricholomella constricta]